MPGRDQIKESPPSKKSTLPLTASMWKSDHSGFGATADKHHLGGADAQELSASLPLHDIWCVCEAINMTKEGAVRIEEGLTLTSQGCRKSLVDQNVQRTKS